MKLKTLTTKKDAERILRFFFSGKAFYWELSAYQKESIRERINNALKDKDLCRYWLFEDKGKVVAAGAVQKDEESKDGYFIGWLGVHEGHRRQGLGRKILEAGEKYVRSVKGRFITVDTAEGNKGANKFYKSLGYKLVGKVPNYYGKDDAKVIYYKSV